MLSFRETPLWFVGLIQLQTWMIRAHLIFWSVAFWCHTEAYSPFRSRFIDLPLICVIIIAFEIHTGLMIRFHCVLILRGASFEHFSPIHVFWYGHDSWTELSQVRGFPLHPFNEVHVRSFVRPHGVTLELSGQIRYIRCHTGTHFPHLAKEAIVLS